MQNARSLFQLDSSICYLNCAYMSPQLISVEQAGIGAITQKRNPAGISPDAFFEETEVLRGLIADLIHAPNPKRIVLSPAVSYGMANVAHNLALKSDEEIVIAGGQFPSNVYPWMDICERTGAKLRIIEAPEIGENRGEKWNLRILEAINSKTRLVSIGNIHWADGTLFNLAELRKRTNDVDALLVIDGTQSVGALPFSVETVQPDALVCAGYKWLMGPYSIGFTYYGSRFDNGRPLEHNWINRKQSEDFSKLVNYQTEYQPGALRYEVGEHSNFILVPMFRKAIEQILRWKPEHIQAYTGKLIQPLLSFLGENNMWVEKESYRASHLFGIHLPDEKSSQKIKEEFSRRNISVSIRGEFIRISPHVYNSADDIDSFIGALKAVL